MLFLNDEAKIKEICYDYIENWPNTTVNEYNEVIGENGLLKASTVDYGRVRCFKPVSGQWPLGLWVIIVVNQAGFAYTYWLRSSTYDNNYFQLNYWSSGTNYMSPTWIYYDSSHNTNSNITFMFGFSRRPYYSDTFNTTGSGIGAFIVDPGFPVVGSNVYFVHIPTETLQQQHSDLLSA